MAHRTYGGGFHGQLYMAAVAAEPQHLAVLFEHLAVLQVFQQLQIPFLVGLFDFCHALKLSGQLQKALFFGSAGHSGIHFAPFLMLARCGCHQIFSRVPDAAQRLEPQLGVFLFVQGRLLKQSRDLLVALLLGLAGIVVVLVPGLRFPGKGDPQIGLRFAPLQFRCALLSKFH